VAKVVSHVNEMAEQKTDSTVRSGQDWPRASFVPRCAAFSTCPWHAHGNSMASGNIYGARSPHGKLAWQGVAQGGREGGWLPSTPG
jgi:hypothetical protein